MPGERLGDVDSPTIRLLLALEKFGKQFPGFEREVHGIEVDAEGDYWMRSVVESTTSSRGKNGATPGRNAKRKSGKPPAAS
jgi:arginine decarboxylase